jgi:hypothetical protein
MSASFVRHRLVLLAQLGAVALLGCQTTPGGDDFHALDSAVISALEPFVSPAPYEDGRDIAPGVEIPDPDLWRDLRSGFALDRHRGQRRVQQELRWLERHPNYLINMQARLAKHLAYIHQRVRARGLPSELALLPIVESALDPYALLSPTVVLPACGSSFPPLPRASVWIETGGTTDDGIRLPPRRRRSTTWNVSTSDSTTGIWLWRGTTPARVT